LGANVYGNYYPIPVLSTVNYASTVLASIIFGLILVKFYQAAKKDKSAGLTEKVAPVI
jgi:hypothetical protein